MTKKTHKLFWILLMILIVVSAAFVYFDDYRTETVEAPQSSNTTQPLQEGQLLTQTLHCEGDGLNSIQIPFSTGNRVNHCMIYADLIVDGECAQSWELPAWKLQDGSFWSFPLDSRLNRCGEKRIEIALRTDGTPEESPSLCICSHEGSSGLSLDGKPLENTMVCYKLQYKRGLDKLAATFLCHFVIAALFLLVLLLWTVLRPAPLRAAKAFLCLWIPLSILYASVSPPLSAPDEMNHFFRSYEISLGHLSSEFNEEIMYGGRNLPFAPADLRLLFTWHSYMENRNQEELEEENFVYYSSTALYAPATYLPQAAGILAARSVTSRTVDLINAGCLAGWLCITGLLYLTLKILPYGKSVLALILLMPMNLQESVSLAPDGLVTALSAFLIAFTLYLRDRQQETMSHFQVGILYVAALWISMCKIVYLPFCLFLLLIPFERFRGGKKGKCLHALALTFLVFTINLLWLGHCRIFLNHLGTNSPVQLAYIMTHPLNYYTTVWRTFLGQGGNLILQTAGLLLGSANVQMSGILLLPYLFLIAHKANAVSPFASSKDSEGKAGLRAVCTAVLLIITILTFTSVYLSWTPVSDSEIIGLQGRYFIPLLFPLYLLVTGDRTEGAESSLSFIIWWAAILVNLCAAARIMFTLL